MIDYKALKDKFSQKLQEFDKQKLATWLEFDQNREQLSKLIAGETIELKLESAKSSKLNDKRENCDVAGDNNYALAA